METSNLNPDMPDTPENNSWRSLSDKEQIERQAVLTPRSFGIKKRPGISTRTSLSGEESEKVPGVMDIKSYSLSSQEFANKAFKQFSEWKRQIETAKDEELFKFIIFCDKEIKTSPLIPEHPELIQMYRNVQAMAVSKLGIQLLSPLFKKMIFLKTLKKPEDKIALKNLKLEIDNDLKLLENSYELRLNDPDIKKDEEIKIAGSPDEPDQLGKLGLQGQVMQLRQNFEKLTNSQDK